MWVKASLGTLLLVLLFALEILLGPGGLPHGGILGLRLTRALLAIFVGASLASSGAALQALFQNPLADPYVLGTASGAALGYALGVFAGLNTAGALSVPAMAGAVASLFVVYGLSLSRGRPKGARMLLAGVMVGFFASSLVAVFMILSGQEALRTFYVLWGNLGVVVTRGDVPYLAGAAGAVLVGMVFLFALARPLDALSLGESEALSMGVDVGRLKTLVFVITGIMVGLATAAVGAVGFVGLMVPHITRRMFSPKHALLIPASGVAGAALVLGSDLILRLVGFYQLPVGILTSLAGAPFFLYIMRRSSWS